MKQNPPKCKTTNFKVQMVTGTNVVLINTELPAIRTHMKSPQRRAGFHAQPCERSFLSYTITSRAAIVRLFNRSLVSTTDPDRT
jgi:hypothetical protein